MSVYQIFIPGGNKTALVMGLEDNLAVRKQIQDVIMEKHKDDPDGEVEQVGFLSTNLEKPTLLMAGGEFCGNASRAAAAYYLKEKQVENLHLSSSGASKLLQAKCLENGEISLGLPLPGNVEEAIEELGDTGVFWVQLEGISHMVVSVSQSLLLLQEMEKVADKEEKKNIAMAYLEKQIKTYHLKTGEAYGLMLLEEVGDILKMHPFVYVKTSETCYYETACGSGSICVAMVECFMHHWGNTFLPLLQPSGQVITTSIEKREDGSFWGKMISPVTFGEQGEVTL